MFFILALFPYFFSWTKSRANAFTPGLSQHWWKCFFFCFEAKSVISWKNIVFARQPLIITKKNLFKNFEELWSLATATLKILAYQSPFIWTLHFIFSRISVFVFVIHFFCVSCLGVSFGKQGSSKGNSKHVIFGSFYGVRVAMKHKKAKV